MDDFYREESLFGEELILNKDGDILFESISPSYPNDYFTGLMGEINFNSLYNCLGINDYTENKNDIF